MVGESSWNCQEDWNVHMTFVNFGASCLHLYCSAWNCHTST